ncbi:MAG TPA: ParB/RepB/Spo0J family partition protein [Bacteroidetes bacterium]|nr:ParB/RepB/Spo0J family partition protein [Bacteroidota bacterium]
MAQKNALGRGLSALIDDADREKMAVLGSINEIDINLIETNPFQPRSSFDEDSLNELAASIKQMGIIQPVTVRLLRNDRFQLITGERRYRAALIAGLKTIPAYIRTADDQALLELALVENIQREDLDSIEIAISYKRLIEECNLTQEEMSDRVGKKRSTVSNYLRLLKLPAEIQLAIRQKEITMGHARALINMEDPRTQIKLFYKVREEGLSVRQTEELVRKAQEQSQRGNTGRSRRSQVSEEYRSLQDQLRGFFDTQVQFRMNDKGKGKIVIPFESTDELERIVSIFDKLNS